MKLIAYYLGSDARWLTKTFPTDLRKIPYILFVRLRAWILHPIIDEYWITDAYLHQFIVKFKRNAKVVIKEDCVKYNQRYPKINHKGFNILYYYPAKNEYNKKYCQWVYGKDIFLELFNGLKDVNWIVVDGSQDLSDIFPIIDFYLRPNRHDGHSRLVEECRIQDIPLYWSKHDPDINYIKQTINFFKTAKNVNDATSIGSNDLLQS